MAVQFDFVVSMVLPNKNKDWDGCGIRVLTLYTNNQIYNIHYTTTKLQQQTQWQKLQK